MVSGSFYYGQYIQAYISYRHIELTLPYAPACSPVENGWSKLKSLLRRLGASTDPDLLTTLDDAFAESTKQPWVSWFTHGCYWTSEA